MAGTIHKALVVVALAACGRETSEPTAPRPAVATTDARGAPVASADASTAGLPPHRRFPTLAAAIDAIVPADARVLGIGEIHARTDRAQVRPALAAFREDVLPVLGARISDLVLETWIVDPKCGKQAQAATERVTTTMKRPPATQTELSKTIEAARGAGVQIHAMRLSCADYATVAPEHGNVEVEKLLGLVTRELTRIATSAVVHRDKDPAHRPLIAVYGGALHNDRFPYGSTKEWSYAARVDAAAKGKLVEIDLFPPELAAAEALYEKEPWFPLVAAARPDLVMVFERGERSFVVVLPVTLRQGSGRAPDSGPAKP